MLNHNDDWFTKWDERDIGNVQFAKADIRNVKRGIICHGVNTHGVMGAGVALVLRLKWPSIMTKYVELCNGPNPAELLGQTDIVQISEDLYIANCFSQVDAGPYRGTPYASADAIEKSLIPACNLANEKQMPLYMPEIGGLRGGLNFHREVLPRVYYLAQDYAVNIRICSI